MELKSTIDIILKDLQEARKIIDDLKKYPGVPVLQLELAMAKCRSAEDVMRLLGELSESNDFTTPLAPSEEEENANSEPVSMVEPTDKKEEGIMEKLVEESTDDSIESLNTGNEVESDIKLDEIKSPNQEPDNQILADRYSHLSERINEQIGDTRKENRAVGLSQTVPISDLSKAIGLNDKFYFIRELFDGDADGYKNLIEKLNKAGTVEEADIIMKESVKVQVDPEPVKQLLELVERKLSAKSHE